MTYYNLQVHSAYDLLNSTIKYTELFSKLKNTQKTKNSHLNRF